MGSAVIRWEAALPQTRRLLERLGSGPALEGFYLAGGTGLALQLGHRVSVDLDFFSEEPFAELALPGALARTGAFGLERRAPQTVVGVLDGVKVSFLGYPYPLLESPALVAGVRLASIADIACMKIDTVASRGSKRDFIDLYWVAREYLSLTEILGKFAQKYKAVNYNLLHLKKSLVYFAEAEDEPMPNLLKPADWGEIKNFFIKEVARLEPFKV